VDFFIWKFLERLWVVSPSR